MRAYYNDNDAFCAAWLRELIKAGHLPPGDVDERPIQEVRGDDLKGYEQVHFFAGIGGWAYALRLAGWPPEEPVWTGSCPCQPYSQAGKGRGDDDPRNLWPHFRRLISERRPPVVFGEQVASKAGRLWLAGVRADLEALGYAVGAADLCAACLAAPHIRQRLFWVADASSGQLARWQEQPAREERPASPGGGLLGGLADGNGQRRDGEQVCLSRRRSHQEGVEAAGGCGAGRLDDTDQRGGEKGSLGAFQARSPVASARGGTGRMEDSAGERTVGSRTPQPQGDGEEDGVPRAAGIRRSGGVGYASGEGGGRHAGAVPGTEAEGQGAGQAARREPDQPVASGFWSAFDLVPCADGKARRVEPGTFPLAHRVPARVGRLRGYGNAIVPQVAAEFVRAWREAMSQ